MPQTMAATCVSNTGWGCRPSEIEDDLDVLPGGMENLGHRLVGHQLEKWLQVDVRRQRIDQGRHAGRCHLDQAEFRPKRRFAQMNSVSTVITLWVVKRAQASASCSEVVIRSMDCP